MKLVLQQRLAILTTAALTSLTSLSLAQAASFKEQPTTGKQLEVFISHHHLGAIPKELTGSFSDIATNPYQAEIEEAVKIGFIAGFEDNTFRPQEPVTREQAVSMLIDAMNTVSKVDLNAEPTRPMLPFSDVDSERWSAKKIGWAQWNFIIFGNARSEFRPTEPITRAEFVSIIREVAEHLKGKLKLKPTLTLTEEPLTFSDLSGHWSQTLIEQMSGYCRVASPLNEKGAAFVPDAPAHRDYAAAAIVKMLNCVKKEPK
ncbi:MAG: S-layer homology domain-containing protein [Xenococcaceae cyanobacterium]